MPYLVIPIPWHHVSIVSKQRPGNHLWPGFFMPFEGTLKPFSEPYQAYKSSHKVQSHHGMFLEAESWVHMFLGVILHFLRQLLLTSLEV